MTERADQSHLVDRARAGDARAFGLLVRRYQNAANAIALGHLRRPADPEDVVQEAFVAAWCRLGQLRDTASFGGWFRRIVTAQSLQWLRRGRARSRATPIDTAGQSLVAHTEDPEARRWRHRLWHEVRRLPEPYRTAALLYYLSDVPHAKIADFLDVPVTTVQDLAYQIATRLVRQVASLADCRNAALFCGGTASIEVPHAEGADLLIEGTRASMGLSTADALRSAGTIDVQADRVADFAVTGPHPGEAWRGTGTGDGMELVLSLNPGPRRAGGSQVAGGAAYSGERIAAGLPLTA